MITALVMVRFTNELRWYESYVNGQLSLPLNAARRLVEAWRTIITNVDLDHAYDETAEIALDSLEQIAEQPLTGALKNAVQDAVNEAYVALADSIYETWKRARDESSVDLPAAKPLAATADSLVRDQFKAPAGDQAAE